MQELIAGSALALTVTLAVGRPRVGPRQVGPATAALAGVSCLLLSGIVGRTDLQSAAADLWRPFITILSIMVTTAAAHRMGVIGGLAAAAFSRPEISIRSLFFRVFALSGATASLLNNDAAVLLLTPLVLALIQGRYPSQPHLLAPFAFGVFMAAGVAPFVVSNPMNLIVASYAGLDFNAYTAVMLPISLAGWVVAFVLLRGLFAAELNTEPDRASTPLRRAIAPLDRGQWMMLGLLIAVLGSYPIVASLNGSAIWVVSLIGALAALGLACRYTQVRPVDVLARDVAWGILVFLPAVFVLALGLRNVGLVGLLEGVYQNAGLGVIGAASALGSAVLNNHPMAMMNMLALGSVADVSHQEYFAALIGGDLGPRLLPMGSLAGLLWLDACRRRGVEISLALFVKVGLWLTIPTLGLSLLMLSLL